MLEHKRRVYSREMELEERKKKTKKLRKAGRAGETGYRAVGG